MQMSQHTCDAEILGACLSGCSARCASKAAVGILSIGGCRVHQEIHPLYLPCRIGCACWAAQHGSGPTKLRCTYHLHRDQAILQARVIWILCSTSQSGNVPRPMPVLCMA